jgi:hypothetical protein
VLRDNPEGFSLGIPEERGDNLARQHLSRASLYPLYSPSQKGFGPIVMPLEEEAEDAEPVQV